MIRRLTLTATAALALLAILVLPAQAQQEAIEIVDIDTSATPQIAMTVALPTAFQDSPLDAGAFALSVGGTNVPVQATPLRSSIDVALVIDTSGSMAGAPMTAAKAAARQFLDRLDPDARVAVVGFGPQPNVVAELGSDRDVARAAIDRLQAGGETAVWDALLTATSLRQDRELHVVLLSDGADTVSTATADEVVAAYQQRGEPLYALTLSSPEADLAGVTTVVDQVGGLALDADDPSGLAPLYDAVASRLSNLWRLSFTAAGSGPEQLQLTVSDGAAVAQGTSEAELVPPSAAPAPAPVPAEGTPGPPTGPELAPLTTTVLPDPGFLQSSTALVVGAGMIGAALLLLALVIGIPRVPRLRLSAPSKRDGSAVKRTVVDAADRALSEENRGRLDLALEQADSDMRPAEYVATVAAVGLAVGLVAALLLGPLFGATGLAVPLVARARLSSKATKRRTRFADQLPDTLLTLSASLRSGRALSQALEMVANEAPEPTASEFGRVVIETRVGRDLVESLQRAAERTGSADFDWVVRAMAINRELGGDLSEVLDNVGETIRDRAQIQRHVKSLSAEGRLSAWILLGLPVGVALIVTRTNEGYLDVLFTRTAGQVMVGVGLTMFALGGLWIRRIIDLKY